jgi:hypothetical protein
MVSVALLTGLVLPTGAYLVLSQRSDRALRDAIAEADRLSPGWRLDDIEAARVSPRRNAAYRVLDAAEGLPPAWRAEMSEPGDDEQRLSAAIAAGAAGQWLTADRVQSLRKVRDAVMPALAEARALADQPEGRYSIIWERDGFSTRLPHIETLRDVTTLLSYDTLLRTEDGDVDGALISCLAVFNAGRSLGDEPLLISQLVRCNVVEKACRLIEYALARGEPSDAALAIIRLQLENEEVQPILWWALRGERATMDRFLACVESGEFTPNQLRDISNQSGFSPGGLPAALLIPRTATNSRAALLRYLSRAVEIANLPPEEQHGALTTLEETVKDMPMLARTFAPSFKQAVAAVHHIKARLRCASAAIAAERYRLAHGQWPSSLGRLVPELLAQVPTSPIDGRPLRFRRFANGVLISAVDEGAPEFDDLEFRLWDVPHRHRPMKPAD